MLKAICCGGAVCMRRYVCTRMTDVFNDAFFAQYTYILRNAIMTVHAFVLWQAWELYWT